MNFAKNIAKRYKKSEAIKAERGKRIKERMEAKAAAIATNATSQKVEDTKVEEVKEEEKVIDIERKVAISIPKKTESGQDIEEQNIFAIKYLPRTGENWKETAKALQVTDEEIEAIEKWNAENKEE